MCAKTHKSFGKLRKKADLCRLQLKPFKIMTTREGILTIRDRLGGIYESGELEAMTRMIMSELLNYSPIDMVLRGDIEQPEFFARRLDDVIARLSRHEPIQQVLGVAWFHGHRLRVTRDTLVPRPETEQLVDLIVSREGDLADLRVLDIGTGSGCIAIALARALRWPHIHALDISEAALAVARENAEALKVNVDFFRADVLTMPPLDANSIDVVVSNPPYVLESERTMMEPNVLDYEPATALFVPDDDPLLFYRAISAQARVALVTGGRIYFEINSSMGNRVAELLETDGFRDVELLRDSWGNDRFAIATKTD